MNRGPTTARAANGDPHTMAQKSRAAWGDRQPAWVAALASLADQIGLKAAGARVGYSGSAVSQVCNAKYPGDLSAVEGMVRAAIVAPTVACPVLDEISREDCLINQKKPFSAASRRSAHLYHACRSCQHARPSKGHSDA